MKYKDKIVKYCIVFILSTGLAICIVMLFPQVRQMIVELAARMLHKQISISGEWTKMLQLGAMRGLFFIAVFGYCSLTASGKALVCTIKNEIRDCLGEIDWRSFIKPTLIMSGIFLLGIISIIRANFLYFDDTGRAALGYRRWYDWSRYAAEFFSMIIHADYHLTDISPLPQLLAVLFLAVSSVSLVYVLNNKKITIIALLAGIPLGLSPYMLECLSFKFDAPYMALSVLASIVPFLFISRKKAFVIISVASLLIMCITYQAASGIYLLIALVLGFNDWNRKRKTNREVFSFLGSGILSFCLAMIIFRFLLMRPYEYGYATTSMLPFSQLFPNVLINFRNYISVINGDFGFIWKALIGIILCFFIFKSFRLSAQNKMISILSAIVLLSLLFFLSYGVYIALERPLFKPRALFGAGILLAIISIYVVLDYNKTAKIFALTLSWSFLVFALSYGNALSDQKRYAEFRTTVLLHDLSVLYPDKDKEENKIYIQLQNRIGFAPSVVNIAKHNPVIYRLVPQIIHEWEELDLWPHYYYLLYFNYGPTDTDNFAMAVKRGELYVDYTALDLPVVLKTYYHTIRSDGKHVLVELNEGIKP